VFGFARQALIAACHEGPWWQLDDWHPRCDPRIPLIDREPVANYGCSPSQITHSGLGDVRLCEFLTSPHFARLSISTRKSYAADLRMWLEYLGSRGLVWSDATPQDVNTYWLWRSRSDLNENSVSGSKTNRELAAISLLYRWASHPTRGHVSFNPVERESLRPARSGYQRGTPVRSRNVVGERVKWVTPRTYRLWRKVGIEGYTLDDLRSPSFKGRNALRNKAMMEMLYSSGLRITEGASLLTLELPAQDRHAVGLNEATCPLRSQRAGTRERGICSTMRWRSSTVTSPRRERSRSTVLGATIVTTRPLDSL
jgi:hypothetical protein